MSRSVLMHAALMLALACAAGVAPGGDLQQPRFIKTIRDVGYRFEPA
jgi:hypothetical protein